MLWQAAHTGGGKWFILGCQIVYYQGAVAHLKAASFFEQQVVHFRVADGAYED